MGHFKRGVPDWGEGSLGSCPRDLRWNHVALLSCGIDIADADRVAIRG